MAFWRALRKTTLLGLMLMTLFIQHCASQMKKTQAFLERLHLPSLSEEEATEMTQLISSQEISNAIKALENIKSPGTDGF